MIIPAIIPESLEDLEYKVSLVKNYVSQVQVDVCDGVFAPTRNWPLTDWQRFVPFASGEEGLPYWQEVQYEAHLMVQNSQKYLDDFIQAGFSSIIIHGSTIDNPTAFHKKLKAMDIEFGLGLTPSEYSVVDEKLFDLADFVQVMGADEIGRHGVELTDEALDLIKELGKKLKDKPIAVDIGVNQDTVAALVKAGATRLVAGSAVFGADNIQAGIAELEALAEI